MTKKDNGLKKVTLNLREGDFERLRILFPEIGASIVIRKLVSNFLDADEPADHRKLKQDMTI